MNAAIRFMGTIVAGLRCCRTKNPAEMTLNGDGPRATDRRETEDAVSRSRRLLTRGLKTQPPELFHPLVNTRAREKFEECHVRAPEWNYELAYISIA